MSGPWTTRLRVAVLLTFPAQLLDMSGIDLFGMLSKEYMSTLPGPMGNMGMDVSIFYIGHSGADETPNDSTGGKEANLRPLTAEAYIKADLSVSSPAVQPGNIDILLIPGPPPGEKQPAQTLDFVRSHAKFGTTILVVCTGCFVAAQAGILDHRKASGPRALVPQLRKDYGRVAWDDDRRFVKDTTKVDDVSEGELWTSGGICNGLEMIAAFIKEKVPGPLSEIVCTMADVGDKGEFYNMSVGADNAWWLGQILRALFFGKRASRVRLGNKKT